MHCCASKGDDELAICVERLSVRYADTHALRDASLRVKRGTLHMLVGANGSGKSTLLRACAGLLRREGRDVRVTGSVLVAAPSAFVFQNPDHQIILPSVGADVAFGVARLGLSCEEIATRVEASLSAVGLQGFGLRPVHTLSGGQKQRCAIAGALAEHPTVLLCDELTSFLDPSDQFSVVRSMRAVVDGPSKLTVLWVTHRLEELEFADRVTCLDNGRDIKCASGARMLQFLKTHEKSTEEPIDKRLLSMLLEQH